MLGVLFAGTFNSPPSVMYSLVRAIVATNDGNKRLSMADVQVTCINKLPRDNTHEGITHLGGHGWRWTRPEVIASIENKTNTFYTMVGGHRADVGVVKPTGRLPYVRTHRDGQWN